MLFTVVCQGPQSFILLCQENYFILDNEDIHSGDGLSTFVLNFAVIFLCYFIMACNSVLLKNSSSYDLCHMTSSQLDGSRAYLKVFGHKSLSLDVETKLALIAICGIQPCSSVDLL